MTAKKFPARLDLLHQMLKWILKCIETAGFEKNDLRKIEIASEEVLVNIIKHAYQETSDKSIWIDTEINKDHVKLKFLDKGPQFNPTEEKNLIEQNIPLEKRSEGGLGLILIRQYMDEIAYERRDSMNVLVLTKKIRCY